MQLKSLGTGVALGLALATPVMAGPEDAAATYRFRFFTDSDEVQVRSHFLEYGADVGKGVDVFFHVNHENLVVPGVQAPIGSPEAVDAITTASRPITGGLDAFRDYGKTRNELTASAGTRNVSGGYYLSHESDYFAQMVRGTLAYDFFREHLNLSVGSSYGWDDIEPHEDARIPESRADSRTTWNLHAVVTQVLSPTTLLRLGAEMNQVDGLQHNPYRNVYAGGGPEPELHPDHRNRRDLFLKVSQYLRNRSSLKVDYRYYTDDWGLRSHTLGGAIHQYVTEDVRIRYRYRYYDQNAATFYRVEYEEAGGIDGYRTGDYRLGAFTAHLFGVQADLTLGLFRTQQGFLRRLGLRLAYERYFNTNNFSANLLESGLTYRF